MKRPWTSRIDASLFYCAHCRKFLRPPSFKCDAGHVVCQGCCDGHLQVCSDAVTKSCIPCPDRDLALRAPMLSCVHRDHGCTALLAYHEWADHVSSCNLAPWTTSRIDASLFDCAHCRKSLKPPTFKCDAGHVVCQDCCDGHLQNCSDGVNKPCIPCPDRDLALRAPMLFCVHREHGCTARLAYNESAEHLRSCNSAPCECPGCAFTSSPAALLQHFSERHKWPVLHKYVYGQPWKVPIRRGWAWRVAALAGESDGYVFLVRTSPAGMGGMAVWVVCLRASEDAHAVARQFRCELWLKGGGGTKVSLPFSSRVPSSDGSELLSNTSMVLMVRNYRQLPSKAALMVRIHKDGGEASSSDDDGSSGDEASEEDVVSSDDDDSSQEE